MKKYGVFRYSYLLILSLLLLSFHHVRAQDEPKPIINASLMGTIIDANTKEPIEGATIQLEAVTHSVKTNREGRFQFVTGQKLPFTLILTSVGYAAKKVVIERSPAVIELTPATEDLDEVVVVGYGTQRRRDLTGSLSSVSTKALQQQVNSFDKLLQGTVAGAQVTATSGQPGAGVSIKIRGSSSIQGGTQPLFVIDGFPLYDSNFSDINPADIESIDVLKDASATAIYGSRGANGVIIVTTKRGRTGAPQIGYDGVYGVESVWRKIPLLGAQDFARLRNEALFDRDPSRGQYQYLSEEDIQQLDEGTNWQEAGFRDAKTQNHQLSISGGGDKTRYLFSTGYIDQQGTLLSTDFRRINTRINFDTQLSDKIKFGLNLAANVASRNNAPAGTVSALLTMPPTATIYDANGNYTLRNPFENIISNPIASLALETNNNKNVRTLTTAFAEYQILKDLSFKTSFGVDLNANKLNSYIPSTVFEGSRVGGRASINTGYDISWLNENILTYSKNIQKHFLNALLGFTRQAFHAENVSAGSSQFISDDLSFNDLAGGAVITTPSSGAQRWGLISYLSRINYQYDDRYFLTGSVRLDGSSRFGKNNKWGAFPSAAVAWRISRENFFRPLASVISDLKIRASYGATGNQEIGLYQSLSTLGNVRYLIGDNVVIGYTPSRIANDLLGWETTNQFDMGIDLGLFSDRLIVTTDFYHKRTNDLLLNVEIPWTTGHASSLQNFGSVENKGIEIGIRTQKTTKGIIWNSDFNIAFNRNSVVKINDFEEGFYLTGNYVVQVGKPLGSFYGTVTDGVLQPGEESTRGTLTGKNNPQPGDRVYRDLDGNGSFSNAADRTIIGTAQPDFIFGFQNTFQWKNIDLSVLLQGSYGNDIINGNRQTLEFLTGAQNASFVARDRWTPSNPDTDVPRASGDPSNFFSDRFVEDGSYIRIKNITLGYTFATLGAKNKNWPSIRVYFTAQNLATITGYSGFDPDVSNSSNVSPGTDSGVYPVPRFISGGLSLKF